MYTVKLSALFWAGFAQREEHTPNPQTSAVISLPGHIISLTVTFHSSSLLTL